MTRNTALLFVCTALSTTLACKKTETPPEVIPVINTPLTNGIPTDKKQNGYFYSAITASSYNGGGSSMSYNIFHTAGFNDPEINMGGSFNRYNNNQPFINPANVDVGDVSINGVNVNKIIDNKVVFYFNNANNSNYAPTSNSANWSTAGNKTFVPLNVNLPRGYPTINNAALNIPTTIYKNAGYTLNINNNITNYDSLIIVLDNLNNNTNSIRKVISNGAQSVTFTSQELSQFYYYYTNLRIYTFNYSYQTVNNKKMVYELSSQYVSQNISLN